MVGNPSIPAALTLGALALHVTGRSPHRVVAEGAPSPVESSRSNEDGSRGGKTLRRRTDAFAEPDPTSSSTTDRPPDDGIGPRRRRRLKPCRGWHPDLHHPGAACTDDANYPDQWLNEDFGLAGRMFRPSARECCEAYFRGAAECETRDTGCRTGTGAGAPPPSAPDDPCCLEFSSGGGCRVHAPGCQALGGTSGPPPPSDAKRCVSPGWHPEIEYSKGCSNGEDYPEQWLMSETIKGNMFKPTLEECCNTFYRNRNCEVYDHGCDIDASMERPIAAPVPKKNPGMLRPTQEPPPAPTPGRKRPTREPTPAPASPAPTAALPVYYIAHGNGLCVDDGETPRPHYVTEVFHDMTDCCHSSWAKEKCLAKLPEELLSNIPDQLIDVATYGSLSLQLPNVSNARKRSKLKVVFVRTIVSVMMKSPIVAQGVVVELMSFGGQSFRGQFRRRLDGNEVEDENDPSALQSLRSRTKRRALSSRLLQFEMKLPVRCDAACQFAAGHLGRAAFDELESHLRHYVASGMFSHILTTMGESAGLFREARAPSATLIYRSAVESLDTIIPTWSPTTFEEEEEEVVLAEPQFKYLPGAGIPAIVGGLVWEDDNANGIRDPGEDGLGGAGILVYDASVGPGDPDVEYAVSDDNGEYRLSLPPGTYASMITAPSPDFELSPMVGGVDGSNFDPFTKQSAPVTLRSGESGVGHFDAGFYEPVTMSPSLRPTPHPKPTSHPTTECSAAKWYFDLSRRHCTNDSNYPSLWEGSSLIFETVDDCCKFHTPGARCAVKDICESKRRYCGGRYHPTTPELPTCSNSHEHPPAWKGNPRFMFQSAEACCEAFYSGKRCYIEDTCW